ncbi:HAMP domain-containing sensor histidine kinase [Paenibacillus sp. CMAA1364]
MIIKKNKSLWWYFVSLVFLIMLATSLIMAPITYLYIRYIAIDIHNRHHFAPIVFITVLSIIIGTIITIMVCKRILAPITNFSNAAKEITKGNLDIHLNESHRVSEIREVAHHFNVMAKELRSVEAFRNEFIVNVSHEYKTPIATIEGYATLLQDTHISEKEHQEYTKMIIDSARQLSTLSGNILKISKLENQEIITEKITYRLDEQIRQAILMLEPMWEHKNMSLHIELNSIQYYGNEELMMQVWLNLLVNAIKFSHEGGDLSFRLQSNRDYIVATLTDTGIGMTDHARKYIFDKFYQADPARYSDGNGLGLPLVRRIINLCGGTIEVISDLGEGSTFTVKLPKE